jgi:outer membrane receptor protein involved in Fe transport
MGAALVSLVAATARADDQGQALAPPTAVPHEQSSSELDVVVRGDREAGEAASRVHVGRRDLQLRPRLRPADSLEAVPGLFVADHAGGGKATQYFLRGFDADHGTDVAFFVDGVPVNMVSHGHGQGYSDFNFLIPELVVGLDAFKGPHYADLGDFATAGAVNLRLAEAFDESFAAYTLGQYGVMRGLAVESPKLAEGWRAVLAAELYQQDGPFENEEDLQRINLFARVSRDLQRGKLTFTWMSYGSGWKGSGQIPARAVCGESEPGDVPPQRFGQPCIDRFGFVDPTEGGSTQRHLASAAYSAAWRDTDLTAMLYLMSYRFSLYSNFTFFRDDALRGDQIEQTDDRLVTGTDVRFRQHVHYGAAKFTTTLGVQARKDAIDTALHHDQARARIEARVSARIGETELGAFVQEDARLTPYLRFIVGVRADRIDVAVDDRLPESSSAPPDASGTQGAMRVSPKWTAIVSPAPELDLFAHYGRGFHSNDARSAVLARSSRSLMTTARGYEVGARLRPLRQLELSAAAFLLDLDSELVWSGDEGTTEPSGATRRYGVELGARYRVSNWLFADIDATLTRPEFRSETGGGRAVPLAPRRTLTAGIGVRPEIGDYTPFGSLRLKSLGDRPLTEDESLIADGFTVVDLSAGLRWKNLELAADVQNLLDTEWREVVFASESRLAYEPAPVTGVHYTPGWPRTVMGRAALYW